MVKKCCAREIIGKARLNSVWVDSCRKRYYGRCCNKCRKKCRDSPCILRTKKDCFYFCEDTEEEILKRHMIVALNMEDYTARR